VHLKGTVGLLNGSKHRIETEDHPNSPAAKRRRLAAQGRLPQQAPIQNGSLSHKSEPAKGLRARDEPQEPSETEQRKAAEDVAEKEALRKEAASIRWQIAEEEAKISAAKVRCFPDRTME
jgi:hypothetical protein